MFAGAATPALRRRPMRRTLKTRNTEESDVNEKTGKAESVGAALVAEARRRLVGESIPRLRKCLSLMNDDEIWRRPNESTASAGNLVLHILGNARQWIVAGLGGAADDRRRSDEFDERGPIPRAELVRLVDETEREIERALGKIDPATLLDVRRVQVFRETGVSILVHVVEHFSYHVGQIGYALKSRRGVDLGYYDGIDLETDR